MTRCTLLWAVLWSAGSDRLEESLQLQAVRRALSPRQLTASMFFISSINDARRPTNAVRMAMSHVDTAGTFRIGLDAYFDNVWAFAYGIVWCSRAMGLCAQL